MRVLILHLWHNKDNKGYIQKMHTFTKRTEDKTNNNNNNNSSNNDNSNNNNSKNNNNNNNNDLKKDPIKNQRKQIKKYIPTPYLWKY